ncbi:LacI family DNA-binding transcriptional regulator [Planococcus lenghuensis]|uniref:LacI family transcriptional regulator n=1 Tax=Planococcus lenghuensis TaxID=2213202 RepID=A0A1Q2L3S8_9BACL|nr:LacI family DNA-binding transcriptional regulator [Planococcus lenghuensis]AQQ54707.1 LacI family transcriptional regulator [Planococcus lenghuensis]
MVSSKDVAKHAGVSQTTVSRVMNEPDKVNKKTLHKVNAAMNELGYRPNLIARSLVNKKTHSIALLSGPLYNPFFADTTTSIVNFAKGKGFNVNVHFENFGDNMSVYQDVLSHQVDGIILSSVLYDDPIYDELKKLDIPFIMFNRRHREDGHFIEMDNFQAGRLAAEHLLELNHRNIVWMGGPLTMSTFQGRYEGFKHVLQENDIPFGPENILITNTSKAAIFEEAHALMSKKNRPTAIFAATDSIAIYMMDFLIERGYSIPEDISILGVDNVELSRHHSFQLSTIGTVTEENLGRVAIEHLVDIINGKGNEEMPFVQKTLPTKLFKRNTTSRL